MVRVYITLPDVNERHAASRKHLVRMEEGEQLRSLMFLMSYLLLKRRRDMDNANIQRRNEIQRRIRHRQYFFQRQRRMLMVGIFSPSGGAETCRNTLRQVKYRHL